MTKPISGEGIEAYEAAFAEVAKQKPAFPIALIIGKPGTENVQLSSGLTKREVFAAMAMQGILSCSASYGRKVRSTSYAAGTETTEEYHLPPTANVAEWSVSYADALLARLEKKP